AQGGAGGVEVRDDLGPVDGVDVAVGVDGDAAVVVGRQRDGAELGERVRVVNDHGRAGQGVDLAVEAEVEVGAVVVAEAGGRAVGGVEADDAVGRAVRRVHVGGEDVVAVLRQAAVADVVDGAPAGVGGLRPGARLGVVGGQVRGEGAVVHRDVAGRVHGEVARLVPAAAAGGLRHVDRADEGARRRVLAERVLRVGAVDADQQVPC